MSIIERLQCKVTAAFGAPDEKYPYLDLGDIEIKKAHELYLNNYVIPEEIDDITVDQRAANILHQQSEEPNHTLIAAMLAA